MYAYCLGIIIALLLLLIFIVVILRNYIKVNNNIYCIFICGKFHALNNNLNINNIAFIYIKQLLIDVLQLSKNNHLFDNRVIYKTDNKEFYLFTINKLLPEIYIATFCEINDYIKNIHTTNNKLKILKSENIKYLSLLNASPYLIWLRYNNKLCFQNKFFQSISLPANKIINFDQKFLNIENQKIAYQKKIIINNKRVELNIEETKIDNNNFIAGYGIITKNQSNDNYIEKKIPKTTNYYYLIENLPIAVAIFNPEQKMVFYNKSFLEIMDISEELCINNPYYLQLINLLCKKKFIPNNISCTQFKQKALKAFQNYHEVKNKIYTFNNNRTLHITIIPTKYGEMIFICNDITDKVILRKNYEDSIKNHYSTINNLQEGLCVFNEHGELKLYNNKFLLISNIPEKKIYTDIDCQSLFLLFIKHNQTIINFDSTKIVEKIKNQEKYSAVISYKNNFFNVNIFPLPDSSILFKITDITAQQLLEKKLTEENKILQELAHIKHEFFASISNEIKAPITSIRGFSEMMIRGMCGTFNEKQQEYLDNIYNEILILQNMMNNILYINSINSGVVNISFQNYLIKDMQLLIEKTFNKFFIVNCNSDDLLSEHIKIDKYIYQEIISNIYTLFKKNINGNKSNIKVDILFAIEQKYLSQKIIIQLNQYIAHFNIKNNIYVNIVQKLLEMQKGEIIIATQNQNIIIEIKLPIEVKQTELTTQ